MKAALCLGRRTGGASGTWLLDPYGDFSATLTNGAFEATGAWEFLPWIFEYADPLDENSGITSAFLAAEYLCGDLSFLVPDDLISEEYTYTMALGGTLDYAETAIDFDYIPEPMTFFLFGLGGIMLCRCKSG